MSNARSLVCTKCGTSYPIGPFLAGCEKCATDDFRANLEVVYDFQALARAVNLEKIKKRPWNMWRYRELLPIDHDENIVTIQEGGTPLLDWSDTGRSWGCAGRLLAKDESRNPTWSFKDRLGSVSVSKAKEFQARVISDSSTGNQGAASAAHAAKAGIPAVIFTLETAPLPMKNLMRSFGARVVCTRKSSDRRLLLARCVEQFGWYPMCNYVYPPVGSNAFGIEGYKTIAYELCEQLDFSVPDVVVFPTDYGDGICGMLRGFSDFRDLGLISRIPKFLAVERFGPLQNAIQKGIDTIEEVPTGPTVALSIASAISTYQALKAIRNSGGGAIVVSDEEILLTQDEIAQNQGCFMEASSAVAFAGIRKAISKGMVLNTDHVVGVITSTGLKDPPSENREIPVVEPDLLDLKTVLAKSYGFEMEVQ